MESGMDTAVEIISHSYKLHRKVYSDLHHREIRLVRLLQGQWPDKIQCRLEHAPLANRPVYKSLSYAWGSPRATRSVFVDGHLYSVTVNLESALRRLRKTDGDLIIWVDALCINQSNIKERTEQVTLMHDIYAAAEEVVVYLGEGPISSSTAEVSISRTFFYNDDRDLHKLEEFDYLCGSPIPSKSKRSRSALDSVTKTFCFLRILARELDFKHFPAFVSNSRKFIDSKLWTEMFEGVRQLLLSRWWNRIWVIQEVVVSKTVTMVYGSVSAPWAMFVNAALWQSRNSSSPSPLQIPHEYSSVLAYFSKTILDIDRMRQNWRSGSQTTFLRLLRQFSGRKASDDRDKVYALLSLAKSQTSILSDYSMSVAEVYQNAVLDSISHTRSLDALVGELGRKDRQDLPSWVTDWSAIYDGSDHRRAEIAEGYRATGSCIVHVMYHGDKAWTGLRHYIESFSTALNGSEIISNQAEIFTRILGTVDWMEWLLDSGSQGTSITREACLTAVNRFYTARGIAVCLENHGHGVISLPVLYVDTIKATAETVYSDNKFGSVFHSWAAWVYEYFTSNSLDTSSLGEIFRKTLCADRIRTGSVTEGFTTRRINSDDHELITTWFVQGLSRARTRNFSDLQQSFWDVMFKDCGDPSVYIDRKEAPPRIDAAVQLATQRRSLFITRGGYIGLGPPNLQAGDDIYLLMGGHTPFILRAGSPHKIYQKRDYPQLGYIERACFQMVGDAYIHGIMDGEIMPSWIAAEGTKKSDIQVQKLIEEWKRNFKIWKDQIENLSAWRAQVTVEKLRTALRSYGCKMTNENILWMTTLITQRVSRKGKENETLSSWKDRFFDPYSWSHSNETTWTTQLWAMIEEANFIMKVLEESITEKQLKMKAIMRRATEIEKLAKQKYVYLV